MKTILYFKNRYIDRLEDLCDLFRGNINEDLKRELIASFQDGTLDSWLSEGDDECKLLLQELMDVNKTSANQDLLNHLKKVFIKDENPSNEINSSYLNFEDFCHIEEVNYKKLNKDGKETSSSIIIKDQPILFKNDEPVIFRLNVKIKVTNPDNEKFNISLKIKKDGKTLSVLNRNLYLNVHKNEVIEVPFIVTHEFSTKDIYNTMSIEFNNKILFETSISNNKFCPIFSSEVTAIQKELILRLLKDMVFVQGGTFTMGATPEQPKDVPSNEEPTHTVTLSDFYIGKTVVTQHQWKTIIGTFPESHTRYGFINDTENKEGDNYPVINISWNDAKNYVNRINKLTGLNFILPTEAQWEYAARGGKRRKECKYSGSNRISDVGWFESNSNRKLHPVAIKDPNELGIYDMSGNVSEWCSDWFECYSSESQCNPQGSSSGSSHVHRGGNYLNNAACCRISFRGFDSPHYRCRTFGFRLALSHQITK